MGMRTITLKLHHPSRRKAKVIDEAMLAYSRAYQYLLDKAYEEIEHIENNYRDENGGFRAVSISKWIDRELAKELNSFGIEPFKDSLKIDFSMTLASFLTLKNMQNEVSYPIAFVPDAKWREYNDRALEELEQGIKSPGAYMKEIRKLSQKCDVLKPIFFCRYALNRDYCLLYDEAKNRYYVKLYMMNVKSDRRKELNTDTGMELKYIHRNGEILEKSHRRERFILVPLEFGKWQEEFLKMSIEQPEMLKTARLLKKGNNYYISINMDIGEKERVKTESYLGLARGLKNAVHFTVVDRKGEMRVSGVVRTPEMSGSSKFLAQDVIHSIANEIVSIASQNKSQVIMQAFIDKGDRLQWVGEDNEKYMPVLNYRSYNKLLTILEYKLDGVGLPPPVKVSPVGVFYTCPNCGLHAVRNRFSRDMFICVECGTTMDIESVGSLNIARKLIKYSTGLLKVKVEKSSLGVRFINKDLGLDFSPSNPMDCLEEFAYEIKKIIDDFYESINTMPKDRAFKKKYSLIKLIEDESDLTKLIEIV